MALPTIQRELAFVAADLQWIVTGYALTFGSFLLLGGRLGDLLGRRRLLAIGLGVFAVASLSCGLSVSPAMLIGSRLIQGAAAAFVSPSAFALLTSSHPEGPSRNRAVSLFQAATAAGASTGVVAGGILVQFLGWRAIFLVNLPIVAVLLVLIPGVIPSDSTTSHPRLDLAGAALVTGAGAALIYGLSNGEVAGFLAPITLVSLAAAVVAAVAFLRVERSAAAPMLPFSYFSNPTHRAAIGSMAIMGGVIAAYVYFVSLYVQHVLGVSPLVTGIALLPSTVTVVVTTVLLTRRLLDRLGVKWMLLLGLGFIGAGQLWFVQLTSSGSGLLDVFPGQLLTAFGIALALPTAGIGATSGVAKSDQGLAGGILTTSQQIGAAVVVALLATIAAARTTSTGSLAGGYALAYVVSAGLVLVAGIWVAHRLNHAACQAELARRRTQGSGT